MKTWKKLCLFLVSVICLLGISITVFYKITNYTGRKAWERYVQECEELNRTAASDTERRYLWLKDLIPPPVDESKNFGNHPLYKTACRLAGEYLAAEKRDWLLDEEMKPWSGLLLLGDLYTLSMANPGKTNRANLKKMADMKGISDFFPQEILTNKIWIEDQKKPRREEIRNYLDTLSNEEIGHLILKRLEPDLAVYRNIQDALVKSSMCRYPLQYEESYGIIYTDATINKLIAYYACWRAYANLAIGDSEEAARDVLFCMDLCDTLSGTRQALRFSEQKRIYEMLVGGIWEGIHSDSWTADELKRFQDHLATKNYYDDLRLAWSNDRAQLNFLFSKDPRYLLEEYPVSFKEDFLDCIFGMSSFSIGDIFDTPYVENKIKNCIPTGWCYRIQLEWNRINDLELLLFDTESKRFDIDALSRIESKFGGTSPWKIDGIPQIFSRNEHFWYFTYLYRSSCVWFIQSGCEKQFYINTARIACALERFRLENGKYPDSLDDLGELLPKEDIPCDWIDGKAPQYHLTDKGYKLWNSRWRSGLEKGKEHYVYRWTEKPEYDWVWEITR